MYAFKLHSLISSCQRMKIHFLHFFGCSSSCQQIQENEKKNKSKSMIQIYLVQGLVSMRAVVPGTMMLVMSEAECMLPIAVHVKTTGLRKSDKNDIMYECTRSAQE